MYRIRRETGDEVTLGSLEELGTAVAAGIVTAGAEIFHARAEKWLPIASHPHFKMANDRVKAGAAQKSSAPRTPGLSASGQRPALGASGQRPAITSRGPAQQARVAGKESPGGAGSAAAATGARAIESSLAPAAERVTPRWSSPQRPLAKAAPAPGATVAEAKPPAVPELGIVRADALVHDAATATEPSEMEFELLPVLDEPRIVEPIAPPASPAAAADDTLVILSVADEPVEQSPAAIELVSHEDKTHDEKPELATSTGVEIINPDRSMPSVMNERELSALEIPDPIRDFATAEPVAPAVAKTGSKLPIMIGVAVAAAAAIGFFVLKPGAPAAPAPTTVASAPAPAPVNTPVSSSEPLASASPAPTPVTTVPVVTKTATPPSGASAGLGGDAPRKVKKSDGDAKAGTEGTEAPAEDVIPAAPTLGGVADPSLSSVETGSASGPVDRAKALEKTRNAIDSSMRQ